MTKNLLVIGGASIDTLHFSGQTASAGGGSGMYTASAAHRAGGNVTFFAAHPHPVPDPLRPFADRVNWIGPTISPDQLPHFELNHHHGQTTYLTAILGAEEELSPSMLPDDLSGYGLVHISPLGSAKRQLRFLTACRQRNARRISVTAFTHAVHNTPQAVQALFEQADLFFMNEVEATGLFGSVEAAVTRPGRLLFVTLGPRGAKVVQGNYATYIRAPQVDALDVTGAGDTFCGTTLVGLLQGDHPVVAARKAAGIAAQMIQAVGPAALWQAGDPPADPRDPRVVLNPSQIERVARRVADLPEVAPFDYTDPNFPPVGHAATLDFLFAGTLQQFSFWETEAGRYSRPLLAPIAGTVRKGSDYLWQSYLRPLEADPGWYTPARQAAVTTEEMRAVFRADDGTEPMPALALHVAQAQAYGQDMVALGLTPAQLVEQANASPAPLHTFLQMLHHIGGYKEDPLQKKSALLAIILAGRPEKFLRPAPGENVPPIIDYHNQRACLRIGLVDVADPALSQALVGRRLVPAADEQAVRQATYDAMHQVAILSGKSIAAVDWFFFNARRYCPEMTEPDCGQCVVDPVCAHRKALFQPVFRTTFY